MAAEYGSLWNDAEFRIALAAYGRMLQAEQRGTPLVKREVVDQLMVQLPGRTRSSVDRRLRNISAVLNELGRPWIDAYKPLGNYPRRLRQLIDTEGTD